jgi:LysM repeat protein
MNWNSWIGSACDTGIYAGLTQNDTITNNTVCIRANGTASATPTSSASLTTSGSSASLTVSASSTISSASMGPTPVGVLSGCPQYYTVQSGDSCAGIESQFGISFQQLWAWNPPSMSHFNIFLFALALTFLPHSRR